MEDAKSLEGKRKWGGEMDKGGGGKVGVRKRGG